MPGVGHPGPDELDLSAAEVKQLWAFQDGSIMYPDVRQHLRKSWGFCPRHTWAAAVTEPALRWDLHGTVLLYEDLTGRAVAALRRPARRESTTARRLEPKASCLTCDFVDIASAHAPEPSLVAARNRVNARSRFTELLLQGQPVWSGRTCPACSGGKGPICRPHILTGSRAPNTLGETLADVRARLQALGDSMRWHGLIPTVEEQSSWVEALGWFAGWGYPTMAAGPPPTPATGDGPFSPAVTMDDP
jgi:hypothetical protein